MVTRWPSRSRAAVRLLPMKPAPPVTMVCKLVPPECELIGMPAKLSMAQPPPDRFRGRANPLGHLTHCEQTLFIHWGRQQTVPRRLPVTVPRKTDVVRRL